MLFEQTSVAFPKTPGPVCRIIRSGTMIGRMVTARLLTTAVAVGTTIALTLSPLAATLVTPTHRLVCDFQMLHFLLFFFRCLFLNLPAVIDSAVREHFRPSTVYHTAKLWTVGCRRI